jgi:hypothetical protein
MLVRGLYLPAGELLWADKVFYWVVLAGAILVTLDAHRCRHDHEAPATATSVAERLKRQTTLVR